jgi:hypothetical protein
LDGPDPRRSEPTGRAEVHGPRPDDSRTAAIHPDGENKAVDLGRIAWLVTVLACLVAVMVLFLDGYYGYAGVTLAVAVSAAINLVA